LFFVNSWLKRAVFPVVVKLGKVEVLQFRKLGFSFFQNRSIDFKKICEKDVFL